MAAQRQAEDEEQQTLMLTTGWSGWLVGAYASLYLVLVSMRLALHYGVGDAVGWSALTVVLTGLASYLGSRTFRGLNAPDTQGLSPVQRAAAVRAAWGGEAPQDPQVLAAAIRRARRLSIARHRDGLILAALGGLTTVGLAAAGVLGSHWWWGAMVGVVLLGLQTGAMFHHYGRRLTELQSASASDE